MNTFPVLLAALCIYALATVSIARLSPPKLSHLTIAARLRRTLIQTAITMLRLHAVLDVFDAARRCMLTLNGASAPQEAFGPPLTSAGEVTMGCC